MNARFVGNRQRVQHGVGAAAHRHIQREGVVAADLHGLGLVAAVGIALGQPVEQLFAAFDQKPLASASIAQVHAATLHDGRKVIVKVVRPGIENTIQRDIELLFTIARMARKYSREARRLRPVEVVAEYDKTIHDELDLMREAANCAQLRRNFSDGKLLYVPEVHWDLTRENVMVQERIYGIPVDQVDELVATGVDLKQLSERGVEIFFTQVFRDNFFHADMHPGNIFVNIDDPTEPQYMAVDFGIVGTLNPVDQRYLAENFLAFFEQDYHRVAKLHIDSGWVPPDHHEHPPPQRAPSAARTHAPKR